MRVHSSPSVIASLPICDTGIHGQLRHHSFAWIQRDVAEGRSRKTYPVADVIGRADVDESADAALEQRGDVIVRREGEHVEVRVEGLVDGMRAPVERVLTNGRVDADERLDVLLVEEVADVSGGRV